MQGSEFGKMVPCEKEKAHKWEIMGYGKALQILTAQKRIMQFLRKAVHVLVGDQGTVTILPTVNPTKYCICSRY